MNHLKGLCPAMILIFLQDLTSKRCPEHVSTELWLGVMFLGLFTVWSSLLIHELTLGTVSSRLGLPLALQDHDFFLFHHLGSLDPDSFQMKQLVESIKRNF